MRLATPRAWYSRDGIGFRALRLILVPLSWIWAAATARRLARGPRLDPGVPVICVGNLTLGGSGKTPIARALARRLRAAGTDAHILMRGHGGAERGPHRVDPALDDVARVGDEALMLSADAPVWVARDRAAGARAAVAAGARALILDDGHQNAALRPSLSLLVVDGETREGEWPFGDGAVVPAGPLREPIATGLARADAVILMLPADLEAPDPRLTAALAGPPLLIARLAPEAPPPAGPLLAFAGIGKPWRFERALRAAGADLVDFAPLADHAPLSPGLIKGLSARAQALGATLVTTEKDAARLPPPWRGRIAVWRVTARFADEAALDRLLALKT